MHSLPLEVKEMIARCCYEQDEALRIAVGRNADGTYPDGARSEVAFACCPVATNTLGTLFCLSTEWAEIAAPFRFAVSVCSASYCLLLIANSPSIWPADTHGSEDPATKLSGGRPPSASPALHALHCARGLQNAGRGQL